MRRHPTTLAVLVIATCVVTGNAWADEAADREARTSVALDRALRAACYGVAADNLTVNGYEFEVASARFARAGTLTIIAGELRHRGSTGSPAVVSYTIRKRGAVLISAEMTIEHERRSRHATIPARHLTGLTVRDEQLAAVQRRFVHLADGHWESAAKLIVTSIALRADECGRDRLAMHRAKLSHTGAKTAESIVVPRADRQPIDRG
jgi:hypothetical protein